MKKKPGIYNNKTLSITLKSIWNTLTKEQREDYPSSTGRYVDKISRISKTRREAMENCYNAYVTSSELGKDILISIKHNLFELFNATDQIRGELESFYQLTTKTQQRLDHVLKENYDAWQRSNIVIKNTQTQKEEKLAIHEVVAEEIPYTFTFTEILKYYEEVSS